MSKETEAMMDEVAMDNEYEMIDVEPETERSGLSGAVYMLIGAGLAYATTAAVRLAKTLYDNHKAKKELRLVDEHDFVEVSEADIAKVTGK